MEQLTNARIRYYRLLSAETLYGDVAHGTRACCELGVTPSVFEGLKRLEDKGYIRRQARKARSIEILHAQTPDKTNLTAVPVLGMVAAGQPILALENQIGQVMVPDNVLRGKCFALKVQGDSMIDADIFEEIMLLCANLLLKTAILLCIGQEPL